MDSQPDFSDTDVDYILDTVIKILEKMNEEEMKFLSKENNSLFIDKISEEFSEFSDRYYTLFRTVIDREDLTNLFKMLEMIQKIQNDKIDIKSAEKQLGDHLADQYLYPVLNKKNNKNK
jgi:hypothetical protein